MSTIKSGYVQWHSPPCTGATNKIKVIARLGEIGEGWTTVDFAPPVLFNHQSVHHFLDDKQLRKATNTATVCSVAICLVEGIAASTQMHLPRASSFNGGFPPDEDMVKTTESMACSMSPNNMS